MNDQETGRFVVNAIISKRVMEESDLMAFHIGIEIASPPPDLISLTFFFPAGSPNPGCTGFGIFATIPVEHGNVQVHSAPTSRQVEAEGLLVGGGPSMQPVVEFWRVHAIPFAGHKDL